MRQGSLLTTFLFNVFFAAAIHIVFDRVSEDEGIMRDLVHLNNNVAGGIEEPWYACEMWRMLYPDDAGIVSKSAERRAKLVT